MQLPLQLEPWRVWLTLFPPELAEAVGELLLRLHPLVGRLNHALRSAQDTPVGVGDIVQRGEYHRLLMTEWLIADAEPDEFIRRAANNELLFTGPEPGAHLRSQQTIVLFDVGPAQLGEPRLVHLALFILLARRAEEAGAQFLWGVLQLPGKLNGETGATGLRGLLGLRTLSGPTDEDCAAWAVALAELDSAVTDGWLLSGPGTEAPRQMGARVAISPDLLTPQLRVVLTQRFSQREILLAVPDTANAVRLLREPFTPLAAPAPMLSSLGRPSLKQPPCFVNMGRNLAVPQLEGGIFIFHVPPSPRAAPGKIRKQKAPAQGNLLGAHLFKKSVGYVTSDGNQLTFSGFPGKYFGAGKSFATRPAMEHFYAPVGIARWLPTFFLNSYDKADAWERLLMIDVRLRLVCWEWKSGNDQGPQFRSIADQVIGAVQEGGTLLFASVVGEGTEIFRWSPLTDAPEMLLRLPFKGSEAVIGFHRSWCAGRGEQGLLAVRRSQTEWWYGSSQRSLTMELGNQVSVIGITHGKRPDPYVLAPGFAPQSTTQAAPQLGLVVLQTDRKTIEFRGADGRYELARATKPVTHAVMDANSDQYAYVTDHRELVVRKMNEVLNLLQVLPEEAIDAK